VNDHPEVLRLYATQHDVVTARQLREVGFAYSTIERAEDRGTLVPLLRGVYTQPGREPTFETKAMAAQLFCGPRSYLCGKTAGALLELRQMSRRRIHITRPATTWLPVPDWIRPRHAAFTPVSHVLTLTSGHRISCPFLTLFVLASDLPEAAFHRVGEDMWARKLIDPAGASQYLDWVRRSGRGGVAVFEAWLERVSEWERPAATGLELDLIAALKAVGLPEPVRQHPVTLPDGVTIHIDIAWPDIHLGLEPGHSIFHLGEKNEVRDASRYLRCNEIGWLIVPLLETFKDDLPGVARQIRQVYGTRRVPPTGA
jgi:hypothetical protein